MDTAMKYSVIAGTGSFLPERVVSNDALAAELATRDIATSDEWIVERTGIRQRHLAERGVTTSQLATEAARRAMADAGVEASEIDLIVLATSTPDFVFPSTAWSRPTWRQGLRRLRRAGRVQRLRLRADHRRQLHPRRRARCALVIGAEVFSRILDWNDRKTCVLFGDGAGAVILKASDKPGILAAQLHADGSQTKILSAEGNVAYGSVTGDPFLRMDGQAVFKQAVTVLDRSARDTCAEAGVDVSEVDWLIPHRPTSAS